MARRYNAGPTEYMRRSRSGSIFFLITAIIAVILALSFVINFALSSSAKAKAEEVCKAAEAEKNAAKQTQEAKTEEYNALVTEIEGLKQQISELS